MMNRRCARILCVLVLTVAFAPLDAAAADPEVKKPAGDAVEQEGADPRIDLERDFANKLVRPDGMEFEEHHLGEARKIDYFLVYFGAHWCPNCRKFTPKLTEFYRQQHEKHPNFEVIFVSADKDEDAMLQYMNGYKMPWPAVKFGAQKEIASLKALAGRGYPCIALVNRRGKLLAHSYGEDRKGTYVEPHKLVEKLEEILDGNREKPAAKPVARK
jgi:nucleoredoxin